MPFKKGQSGNPGGRPKEISEVKDLARAHTAAAIERLAHWMMSDDARASVAASAALLDRAWGKAEVKADVSVSRHYVARVPEKSRDTDTWVQNHAPPEANVRQH
jgi:hypothetical protein